MFLFRHQLGLDMVTKVVGNFYAYVSTHIPRDLMCYSMYTREAIKQIIRLVAACILRTSTVETSHEPEKVPRAQTRTDLMMLASRIFGKLTAIFVVGSQ
jgi:hypothetical protein